MNDSEKEERKAWRRQPLGMPGVSHPRGLEGNVFPAGCRWELPVNQVRWMPCELTSKSRQLAGVIAEEIGWGMNNRKGFEGNGYFRRWETITLTHHCAYLLGESFWFVTQDLSNLTSWGPLGLAWFQMYLQHLNRHWHLGGAQHALVKEKIAWLLLNSIIWTLILKDLFRNRL